jgi:hypothetical protein
MHLEIPEGANVQIIVGSPTPQALADESRQARPAQTGGWPILKGLAVAIGLVGTFVVGQHFGGRAANTQTAAAFSMPPPAPTREQHAFPDAPLPDSQRQQASGGVPPEFQDQLRQPPTVTPPPGTTSGKTPFGLEQ